MKKYSHFLPYQKKNWNLLELDENMQLNNSSIVLKTCVSEFLTRPTFNFDGLCTFNKLNCGANIGISPVKINKIHNTHK